MRALVVGLGNPLVPGDQPGLLVVRRLMREMLPDGCRVVGAGAPGLGLLDMIRGVPKVVLVDAMLGGGPPGTVRRLGLEELCSRPRPWSLHGFGPAEAIELGRRLYPEDMPKELVFLGIEAGSPPSVYLDEAVRAVMRELEPCSRGLIPLHE